jgi:hypothetical protein
MTDGATGLVESLAACGISRRVTRRHPARTIHVSALWATVARPSVIAVRVDGCSYTEHKGGTTDQQLLHGHGYLSPPFSIMEALHHLRFAEPSLLRRARYAKVSVSS